MNDYLGIKDKVASAVHLSLLRLARGGFVLNSNSSGGGNSIHCISFSIKSDVSWVDELREIAYTSVSFPNGINHANSNDINGSPSDVDVRAALTLYNRIKKKQYELQIASCCSCEVERCNDEKSKKKRHLPRQDIAFDIISDFGTHRRVADAKSLANLLSVEIEQALSTKTTTEDTGDFDLDTTDLSLTMEKPATTFFDIRPSDSGIICLVSSLRSQQLYAAGRVPCKQCIKWCKGMKGLWWHQLKEHGVDYSNAMDVAAGSVNELAVVEFQERSAFMIDVGSSSTPEHSVDTAYSPQEEELDVFDLVKSGDLNALIRHVEDGFKADTHLDKNGANCLHWAAGCGHVHIVSYLIEKCNCCPNQGQVGKRSFSGRTPLHWAARNGHLNTVEYLVKQCDVDIEAKTLDGTTAFCWAAWQGHLDVMKLLYKHRCDINLLNSFGCNALLWCSQGAATPEIFSWLLSSGADFSLVNTNGHSALHKAAQRGNASACKWLVDLFLHDDNGDFDGFLLIGPDAEGACPSDLCGMNGHESLAKWLSKRECDYVQKYSSMITSNAHEPGSKCRKLLQDKTTFPSWLSISIQQINIVEDGGIGRMRFVMHGRVTTKKLKETQDVIESLSEID